MKCSRCGKDVGMLSLTPEGAECYHCFLDAINKSKAHYHYIRAECLIACIEECCDDDTQTRIGRMYQSLTKPKKALNHDP